MIINKSVEKEKIRKGVDHLILIDKPSEWTSFDIVKKVKNIGSFRKVGHAGTLDPFATGLLILGTGRNTKKLSQLSGLEKSYVAKIVFGQETDTYDVTGRPSRVSDIKQIDSEKVRNAAMDFLGRSEQLPPMYSAKKINGHRLYKLARRGITVERKPQNIEIKKFELLTYNKTEAEFYIECSKGTYIRTLAHDLGKKTGYGAYLKELRRVGINGYHVNDALTIDEFVSLWQN
jgi:tRNA pseudouridine55 synthase